MFKELLEFSIYLFKKKVLIQSRNIWWALVTRPLTCCSLAILNGDQMGRIILALLQGLNFTVTRK